MNKKILLVDDDPIQLKLLEKLLVSNHYYCKVAGSVSAAEKLLHAFLPDLIISDYEMPQADGFVFRERLLKNEKFSKIPFLFLTAYNNEDLVDKGLDLNALDYISKAIPPKHLLAKINNIFTTIEEQYQRSLAELKNVAEKLNLRNVPLQAPQLKKFEIFYYNQSFQNQPGGDFIDFIRLDQNYTFIVLGDVMGKKWGAWFFSFSFLSYIRSTIRLCVLDGNFSLSEILNKINKVIIADEFLEDIFSTLSIILLDDKTGKVHYVGAGDLPVLKYQPEGEQMIQYKSSGLLLGFFDDGKYEEQEIPFRENEELLMISDGMIDFEKEGKKKSDIELFKNEFLAQKQLNLSNEVIKNNLFNKGKSQIDDCSIIIIQRK